MVVVWLGAVGLTSCSSQNAGTSTSTSTGPTATEWELSGQSLPIQALLVANGDELAFLNEARDSLIARCMSERGFSYRPIAATGAWTDSLDLRVRYGYLGTGEYGYISPLAGADLLGQSSEESAGPSEDAYVEALWGLVGSAQVDRVPGCYHRANLEIYGDEGGQQSISTVTRLIDLQSRTGTDLYLEPGIVDLQRRWSECMKAAGYNFSGWYDAVLATGRTLNDATAPSEAERVQAQADADCRRSLDFEVTLFNRESQLQATALDEDPLLVSEAEQELQSAINNAAAVLNRDAPGG